MITTIIKDLLARDINVETRIVVAGYNRFFYKWAGFPYFFVFFILFFTTKTYSQDEFISGRVFDSETQNPIPFVNIVNLIDNQSGTTSDREGFFRLRRDYNCSFKIHVNSMGYKDTIIDVPTETNEIVLFLQPVTFNLPEYVLTSTRLKERTIGSEELNILTINDSLVGFPTSAGWSNGVFVTLNESNKTQRIYLKSVSFFVSDQGPLGSAFQVRFLKPKVRWSENKLEPFSYFGDLVYERIIVRAKQRGWNQIDLEDLNIILPKQPFVILFSPVYESDSFYWQTKEGDSRYGAVIAFYRKQRIKNLFWVRATEDKLAYISNKGPGSANPVLAITINFLE